MMNHMILSQTLARPSSWRQQRSQSPCRRSMWPWGDDRLEGPRSKHHLFVHHCVTPGGRNGSQMTRRSLPTRSCTTRPSTNPVGFTFMVKKWLTDSDIKLQWKVMSPEFIHKKLQFACHYKILSNLTNKIISSLSGTVQTYKVILIQFTHIVYTVWFNKGTYIIFPFVSECWTRVCWHDFHSNHQHQQEAECHLQVSGCIS